MNPQLDTKEVLHIALYALNYNGTSDDEHLSSCLSALRDIVELCLKELPIEPS